MIKEYTEEDKAKYCRGFKNCTLPITDYAEKMELDVRELKQWLKEYKEPLPYGAINLANLLEEPNRETNKTSFRFEIDNIKVEITEEYNKELLKKISELFMVMSNAK